MDTYRYYHSERGILVPKGNACMYSQMNNNHNVQDIHTIFIGPEETKQEGTLRDSAGKSTD